MKNRCQDSKIIAFNWLEGGCGRAELFGIGPDRVINIRGASAMTGRARKTAT